jgi:hypothetical protein
MKTCPFKVLLWTVLISLAAFSGLNAQSNNGTRWSVEVDPATYVFNGYAMHLRLQPAQSKHFNLGVGIYAMDFPDPFVDINPNNQDMGWEVRLATGLGLFGEYHFGEVNRGWFVGEQIAWQQYRLGLEGQNGSSHFANLLLMTYGGYSWQPFDFPLYLKPWAGIGYTAKVSGENILGDEIYDIAPVTLFATLHIGYQF